MSMYQVECIHKGKNTLGEMPDWSPRLGKLLWVDVRRPALYGYDPVTAQVREWLLPHLIGSFCEMTGGKLLLALKTGLHTFDLDSGELALWMDPEPSLAQNRLNDGKCDRQGRFWVGSMYDGKRLPTGTLYCVHPDKTYRETLTNITIPNSLAWSPDGRKMYFTDTPTLKIMSYDFDLSTGELSNPQVFRDMSDHAGRPAGSTVDADGCLWNAEVH